MRLIKNIINFLDKKFCNGKLKKIRNLVNDEKLFSELEQSNDGKITIFYEKNFKKKLSSLCDLYGSDKGSNKKEGHPYKWPPHCYTDVYEMIFEDMRENVRAVFECGIGSSNIAIQSNMGENAKPGASLRVWRDYFENARIYGADIDKEVLFEEERISTFYMDQTDSICIKKVMDKLPDFLFDVIIDDGLHTFEAGRVLFESLENKMSQNCTYVIEDVSRKDFIMYKNYFQGSKYKVFFIILKRKGERFGDNGLVIVRR